MPAPVPPRPMLRLTLARAAAWALLLSGWIGLGSLAMVLAPGVDAAFALVALWLLMLGGVASVATLDAPSAWINRLAVASCAALTAAALIAAPRGGGMPALLLAMVSWAALTALASGVVRTLRLAQSAQPRPPIGAASLGALCASVALADLGDLQALSWRLSLLLVLAAALLVALQLRNGKPSAGRRCRAGLFDCSLPAWPAGAWRELPQWPTLLAGLAMLPMMASLPLMVAWCRVDDIAPAATVVLHLGAMFVPALVLQRLIVGWSARSLSAACAFCLAAGAAAMLFAAAPWNLLGLALAHGFAWSLAWAGQLWSPDRRSRAGASPWRAGVGYAVLTVLLGGMVERFGIQGVAMIHVALGLAALAAWVYASFSTRSRRTAAAPSNR